MVDGLGFEGGGGGGGGGGEGPGPGLTTAELVAWLAAPPRSVELSAVALRGYALEGMPHRRVELAKPVGARTHELRYDDPAACLVWIRANRPNGVDGVGHGGKREGSGRPEGEQGGASRRPGGGDQWGAAAAAAGSGDGTPLLRMAEAAAGVREAEAELAAKIKSGGGVDLDPSRLVDPGYLTLLFRLGASRADFDKLDLCLKAAQRQVELQKLRGELLEAGPALDAIGAQGAAVRAALEGAAVRYSGILGEQLRLPGESRVVILELLRRMADDVLGVLAADPLGEAAAEAA